MNRCIVSLASAALTDGFQLRELTGVDAIGRFFEFEIHVVRTSREPVDEDLLLASPASLVFTRGDAVERQIHGVIRSVHDAYLSEAQNLAYTLTFVPRAWPMMHNKRSEIFLDVSVPEILKTKVERAALDLATDADFRLRGTYAPREFVMQYEETDLAFCSRLCEHLGISIFFEHQSGKDVLVFSDDNSGFKPIEGDATVAFSPRGEQDDVFSLEGHTQTIPATIHLKDYNYRTPTVALVAEAIVDPAGRGDVVEYGAHFTTADEGARIANVRAEELRATKRVYTGKSEVPRLASGARFTLDGHLRVEGELLVTEVRHRAVQAAAFGQGAEHPYANEFRAILATTPFRPPRGTPKPRVHGAISGVVEAEQPGKYSELDEQGRYHVRFMLDQGGAAPGKASSLLRMAQPHAGAGYGFHFPLRAGVEVMLTCIDGDPDRPIITGAVPNPTTPSPVSAGNATRNVIRTGGGTEMNIDDTEGGTRFKVTVPFANTTFQLGAPNEPTSGYAITTDLDASFQTGKSIVMTAGTDCTIAALGGDLIETASGSVSIAALSGTAAFEGKAGVMIEGHPEVVAHATAVNLQADATATVTSPVTTVHGDALVAVSSGVVMTQTSGAIIVESAPIVMISAAAQASVTAGTLTSIGAPTVSVSGKTAVNVGAPSVKIHADGTVEVTGAAAVKVSAPNVTVSGGTVTVKGGVVKLNT